MGVKMQRLKIVFIVCFALTLMGCVAVDSTWDTDQLLVNSYIGCYVARNLSRDGIPY